MKKTLLMLLAALAASSSGAQAPLTLDTSFRCTRLVNGELLDILPLADGSVIATSSWTYLDNCCGSDNGPFFWLRIMPNGDIDESWPIGGGTGLINPFGAYYYISGTLKRYFQSTGERDTSWPNSDQNPDLNPGNMGNMAILPDGKVLHVGDNWLQEQWGINMPTQYSLWRFNADGSLDSTYHFRKTDGIIWTIVPTTRSRFLLSGVYNTYESLPEGRILRIWPDGSLDSTFHTAIIKGYAMALEELPDGRILAGGQFVLPDEPDTLHLIRLLPDGTLDPSFNNHLAFDRQPPTSFGAFGFGVGDVQPLADGTLLVAGNFTHINGQLRRGIALLDSTGHLLSTALNGEGALMTHRFNSTAMYSKVNSIRLAPDGSIFLAGFFKGFDDGTVRDTSMTFIAKLHGLSVGIAETQAPAHAFRVSPNPGDGRVQLHWPGQHVYTLAVVDATGRTVLRKPAVHAPFLVDLSRLPAGLYNLLVSAPNGTRASAKWIKQ